MKKYALIIALSLFSQSVWAAPPSDASLQKLMVAMQWDAQFDSINTQLADKFKAQMLNHFQQNPRDDLTPEQNEQLIALIQKLVQKSFEIINDKDFHQEATDAWIQSAKKHYTQEEVDAMIQFYSSPIGQNVMNKQGVVLGEYMDNLAPIMQKRNRQMHEYMEKEFLIEMRKMMDK